MTVEWTDRLSRATHLSRLPLVGLLMVGVFLSVVGFFVYRWRHYISYGYSLYKASISHPHIRGPGETCSSEPCWEQTGYEINRWSFDALHQIWRLSTDPFYEFCASPVPQCSENTVASVTLLTAIGVILLGTLVVLYAVNSIRHNRKKRCSALPILAKSMLTIRFQRLRVAFPWMVSASFCCKSDLRIQKPFSTIPL